MPAIHEEFTRALNGNIDSIKYILKHPKYYTRRTPVYQIRFLLNAMRHVPEQAVDSFREILKKNAYSARDLVDRMIYNGKYAKALYNLVKNFDAFTNDEKKKLNRFTERARCVFNMRSGQDLASDAIYFPLEKRKQMLENHTISDKYAIAYTMHQLKYDGVYQTTKYRIKELTKKDSYKLEKDTTYFLAMSGKYEKVSYLHKVFFISDSLKNLEYPEQLSYVQTQEDFDYLVESEKPNFIMYMQLGLFLKYNPIAQKNIDKFVYWLIKSKVPTLEIQRTLIIYDVVQSVDRFPDIMLSPNT